MMMWPDAEYAHALYTVAPADTKRHLERKAGSGPVTEKAFPTPELHLLIGGLQQLL
jgi:hypothetical protein